MQGDGVEGQLDHPDTAFALDGVGEPRLNESEPVRVREEMRESEERVDHCCDSE